MVSKNNKKNKLALMTDRQPRYSIRKLNIGAASVLLGISLALGINQVDVKADTVETDAVQLSSTGQITSVTSQEEHIVVNESSKQANNSEQVTNQLSNPASCTNDIEKQSSTQNYPISTQAVSANPIEPVLNNIQQEKANSEAALENTVNSQNLTITNDEDLKKFDESFDANQLDQNHLLGIAGGFHIFGENVTLDAHTNGNFVAGNLSASVDFGTRGDSHNHTNGDIYYIEDIAQITNNGFNHENNYIVFGENINLEIKDNSVYVNGIKLDKVMPEQVKQAHQYIDIQKELDKLREKSDEYQSNLTTEGVKIDFSDMNNQTIDVSEVSKETDIIYVNIPAELLSKSQPIYITGLSSEKDGPAIVINVKEINDSKLTVQTQIKLTYENGDSLASGENHAYPNKLLWNFGTEVKELEFSSGHFMGSILATNATIATNVNIDGTIIGQTVHIKGGESHRWDLNHPMEEVEIPNVTPDPTPNPDPEPDLDPAPDSDSTPNPTPEPDLDPEPSPTPESDPEHTPTPDLESDSTIDSELVPEEDLILDLESQKPELIIPAIEEDMATPEAEEQEKESITQAPILNLKPETNTNIDKVKTIKTASEKVLGDKKYDNDKVKSKNSIKTTTEKSTIPQTSSQKGQSLLSVMGLVSILVAAKIVNNDRKKGKKN